MKDALRQRWLDVLLAERHRRRDVSSYADEACERLLAELDEMGERMRAAPGWVEPTEAERQQNLADLEAWFHEHGYGGGS